LDFGGNELYHKGIANGYNDVHLNHSDFFSDEITAWVRQFIIAIRGSKKSYIP
jgi:hypothetical protein